LVGEDCDDMSAVGALTCGVCGGVAVEESAELSDVAGVDGDGCVTNFVQVSCQVVQRC